MIAIIPARGGSKGLPGKNIKPLLGKPLIAYTIEAAIKANAVSEVIVSTDDPEIARVARQYGASIPFMRPAEYATDSSKAIDTYRYTINKLEEMRNISIDSFMVLLPTCPLRTAQDIDAAYSIFKTHAAESVISCTKEHHPITWHKYVNEQGKFENIFEDDFLQNRQELKVSYYPNGAIYIFQKKLILQNKYYSENSYAYIMPRNRSVDIDTQEDFDLAEFYMTRYNA
jgi:CMP-N,N'-diacetyllegionaminic acid synthase